MAPEQLEGDEVDARSDIFALGAVLYEMVTGRKAFEGKSQASLISAIMTSEPPPVSQLQGLTPPALDHVVRTCLAKNPDERWQTSGDVFRQLKWIREGGSQAPVVSSVGAARSSKRTWPSIAAALALGAIVGAFAWSSKPDAPARVARFVATPPSAAPPNTESADGDLAITPDGTRIVYAALHELEAAPLTGLGLGLRAPFISPDGNWVGYFDDARLLRRVSILGGPPVTICTLPGGSSRSRGGSWGRDGTIIFATNASSGLWRVAAGGGEPEEITSANGQNHVFPEILPGGKAVLFTVTRGAVRNVQNDQIAVASLAGGEPKILVPGGGSNPRYASSGHIVYGANGTLRAVGFDLARLEVTSAPIPVLSGVVTKTGGAANFRISDDGSLVYVAGRMSGAERVLVWVDRNGREEVLTAEPRDYTFLRISPDGSRLALDVRDQERDVWIWDFTRETLSRFTFGPSVDGRPVWSPDGQQLIFESHRGGQGNVFAKSARGTGQVERLTESDDHQTPGSISPDGSWLVFEEGPSSRNLVLLSLTGEGVPQPLLQTDFNESDGEISPDGRWLAYSSDESGQTEIYVRPFPNVDEGQWQISRQGGNQPLWASDGSELFYLSHEKRLMAVPFENAEGASISLGQAEVVLQQTYFTAGFIGRSYDVSPDGKRFLMIREDTPGGVNTELIYVQNWLQELKRLVPVQ